MDGHRASGYVQPPPGHLVPFLSPLFSKHHIWTAATACNSKAIHIRVLEKLPGNFQFEFPVQRSHPYWKINTGKIQVKRRIQYAYSSCIFPDMVKSTLKMQEKNKKLLAMYFQISSTSLCTKPERMRAGFWKRFWKYTGTARASVLETRTGPVPGNIQILDNLSSTIAGG